MLFIMASKLSIIRPMKVMLAWRWVTQCKVKGLQIGRYGDLIEMWDTDWRVVTRADV